MNLHLTQRGACRLLAALVVWGAVSTPARAADLKLLARYELPAIQSSAPTDIRFATETSVFLSRTYGGVHEISLAQPLQTLRMVVPDVKTLDGPRNYFNLGASPNFLAVAADSWSMAWRPTALQRTGAVGFYVESVNTPLDIDVFDDRILVLGEGRTEKSPDREGGIAFLGRVSATGLKGYRPVLFDARGAGTPVLLSCGTRKFGAARFLPDGSFVVVPGFQPGAYLFDADGHPVRNWSRRETSLTTDCSSMTREESDRFWSLDVTETTAWMNRQRLLDDILPFKEGPGLLVRSVRADGRTTWELRVLRKTGNVSIYDVPLTGGPEDRLSGDVRAGRIVLLKSSWHYFSSAGQSGEILLLETPDLQAKERE